MVSSTEPESEPSKPGSWFRKTILILVAPIAFAATLLFVGLPMLILAAVLAPFSAVMSRVELRRERNFQASLAAVNRCMDWSTVLDQLEIRGGTLIIEWRHKLPVRLWWTQDDVRALAPCKPPEFDKLDFLGLEPTHPFISWIHGVYTNDLSGIASICIPPYAWSPGTAWASELKRKFPRLITIDIVPESSSTQVA